MFDYVVLAGLVFWIICKILDVSLSHVHLKDQKKQAKIDEARKLAEEYVAYYEQQEISNPEKLSGAVNDVADSLKSKGFNIGKQDLQDIEAMIEWAVAKKRAMDAQSKTVIQVPQSKPKDVPDQPSEPKQDSVPDVQVVKDED